MNRRGFAVVTCVQAETRQHFKVRIASKQGGVLYFSGRGSYAEVVELTELPDQGFEHSHS